MSQVAGYPHEEGQIVNTLLAELGYAQTWQEILSITRAIQNVRIVAERERQRIQTSRQQPLRGMQAAPNFQQQSAAAQQMGLLPVDPRFTDQAPVLDEKQPWEE